LTFVLLAGLSHNLKKTTGKAKIDDLKNCLDLHCTFEQIIINFHQKLRATLNLTISRVVFNCTFEQYYR